MNNLITKDDNNIFVKIVNFFKSLFKKNNTQVEETVNTEVTISSEDDFLPEVDVETSVEEIPEVAAATEEVVEESEESAEEDISDIKVSVDSSEIAKDAKRKQIIEEIKKNPKILDQMSLNEIEKIKNYVLKNKLN